MNKMLFPTVVCIAAMCGCRTPVTPDGSWADYGRYYTPTGETAEAPLGVADVRKVPSKQVDAAVAALKEQGYVALGCFKIDDGAEIKSGAVVALAQKLNASTVVWSSVQALPTSARVMPNPDVGIAGVDKSQLVSMGADRPDQTLSEQMYEEHHVIWMLGKKSK